MILHTNFSKCAEINKSHSAAHSHHRSFKLSSQVRSCPKASVSIYLSVCKGMLQPFRRRYNDPVKKRMTVKTCLARAPLTLFGTVLLVKAKRKAERTAGEREEKNK